MSAAKVETPAENGFAQLVEQKAPYYAKRVELFESFLARQQADVEKAKAANDAIKVTLPDGSVKEAVKGVTTPLDVAAMISKSLAKKTVVAKVNSEVWDVFRPLEDDCSLELCNFDTAEGKDTFWHSSAHVLGQALELEYGVDLTIGPCIEEGFYYDCYMGEDTTLRDNDMPKIEKRMSQAVKEGQPFQRVVVTRDEALSMFQENKFKVEIISGLPADATISLYRCGPMVDLCHGPHVPNTGLLKAVAVNSVSRAFWRADVTKEPLQRVYGITYPDNKQLKEYKRRIEEAKKRDHRTLGTSQELFFFNHLSPGSGFFLPSGARVYNSLVDLMKEKYWKYGYEEVISPNIFNFDLWKTSGHAAHYKENMFGFDVEKQEFGMKPMNCPGHCVIFGHRKRSYRELPIRMAEFGVLHRNEYSGALQGLTRVRRFVQDDAHIFCRPDQVLEEVQSFLEFMNEIYEIFGLDYEMALSTRPEGYLGELALWNQAEKALEDALNASGKKWIMNPGDGAFYGPKIDITVFDALRRKFQCATVQLDFQLPIRFKLEYQTETGFERPVIVHRAILGSVERMFAILTEHFAGKWPMWMSPRQVMIVPISESAADYAATVKKRFREERFLAEVDQSSATMQKKVRTAQLAQYNYILVVGEQEKETGSVNVRTRDNAVHGMHKVEDVIEKLRVERDDRKLISDWKKDTPDGEGAAEKEQKPEKS
ncbi:hypothetical protein BSKO_07687 [Bryopsis sp. KO-2023]|nr:hypothetical protein BSKO_07687 [Bryopsis sp. KO-2023]